MITKFFNKLKSILGRKSSSEIAKPSQKPPVSKPKKSVKSKKTSKTSKTKTTKSTKVKSKDSKLVIDSFTKLPGVGPKSAKALYKAGYKTPKDIISAKDEELLAIPGVGSNLIKKLKSLEL